MSNSGTTLRESQGIDVDRSAQVLKALSNPNRLRIYLIVRDEQKANPDGHGLCVGDIAHALEIAQSTVSHHIKELEHAGMIIQTRQGKNVFCTATCEPLAEIMEHLECADCG